MTDSRTIFVSSEARGDFRLAMGKAHYSYGVVASRFTRMLARAGHAIRHVELPEKMKRLSDLTGCYGPISGDPIHLCFRSSENVRLLPLAANIGHFAWEFDRLKDEGLISEPVTTNQKHMLSLLDEIWVPSAYTLKILQQYGLQNLALVPTPVCDGPTQRLEREEALAILGERPVLPWKLSNALTREEQARITLCGAQALGDCLHAGGRMALVIANPGDLRKNLLAMVEGFVLSASPDDVLIVKLTVPAGPEMLSASLFEHLLPRYAGPAAVDYPNVWVLTEVLDDAEMTALYSLADFYLSASHCEGQNLPLLEAMAYGTLTVATANTAMADVVEEETAVVIPERETIGAIPRLAGEVAGISPKIGVADRFAIAKAIKRAGQLGSREREAKIAAAGAVIQARFSERAVMALVQERLIRVAPQRLAHAG